MSKIDPIIDGIDAFSSGDTSTFMGYPSKWLQALIEQAVALREAVAVSPEVTKAYTNLMLDVELTDLNSRLFRACVEVEQLQDKVAKLEKAKQSL